MGDVSDSPVKGLAPAETREGLTENLRGSELVHELSTTEFATAFFRDPLPRKGITKYLPPNRRELLNAIATSKEKAAYSPVCGLLNGICDNYAEKHNIDELDRLWFVTHADNSPCHHPRSYTDKVATQKPDIVMLKKWLAIAFLADVALWLAKPSNRRPVNKPAVAWPHIGTIVEGKGPNDPTAHFQAATYMGSITQARPDMVGCFGLAVSPSYFRVLWADASCVYYTQEIEWTSSRAMEILVQYVHQLHTPMLDPSISLRSPDREYDDRGLEDWETKSYASLPVWLVRVDKPTVDKVTVDKVTVYVADSIISVGTAWSRKNWVVRATHEVGPDGDEPLENPVVIKDSFQREERLPSAEGAILDHIHRDGPVAGVMEKLTSFVVTRNDQPIQNVRLPTNAALRPQIANRVKYRLVLVGSVTGYMFTTCESVLDALMMLYDVLEMSIVLHEKHGVLHRDLGIDNILRRPDSAIEASVCTSVYTPNDSTTSRRPVFIRQLLAWREPAPALKNSPMCLLLDFDNAFLDGHPTGAMRTAKPTFVASAISDGEMTFSDYLIQPIPELRESAKDAYLRVHGQATYDSRGAFHNDITRLPEENGIPPLYHQPRHDAESCYWVTVWFSFLALPAGCSVSDDDTGMMSHYHALLEQHCIGATSDARRALVLIGTEKWKSILHPKLQSLAPFLRKLSDLVKPEYGQVASPKLDPYHLHEAMQRIFLQEICRLVDDGTPLMLDTTQQRRPVSRTKAQYKLQASLAASAPTVHAARAAEATLVEGSGTAKSGKRARVDSSHASTSTAVGSGKKKQKTSEGVVQPTRTSERRRKKRAAHGSTG